MISRRRMVFQLTALLDLLLVVLFAQYLETQESARQAIDAEAARRAAAEKQLAAATPAQAEADALRQAAAADRAAFVRMMASIEEDNRKLKEELQLLKTMLIVLKGVEGDPERFRERATLFHVYVGDDNSVRLRVDREDQPRPVLGRAEMERLSDRLAAAPPAEVDRVALEATSTVATRVADTLADVMTRRGGGKQLAVVTLSASPEAALWAESGALRGAESAAGRVRQTWGATGPKVEVAPLGYSQDRP